MSETDDTDELLLMTPHIEENLQETFIPYYQIVDKLITQVSKLKNRITSIEHSSDLSLNSFTNSVDTFLNTMHSSDSGTCRRCYSYESIPQHAESGKGALQSLSTQSTPQKPRSKLILKSFPCSPKFVEDSRHYKRPLQHRSGVPRTTIELERTDDVYRKQSVMEEESNIINEIDDFLCNVKPASGKLGAARNLDFDQLTTYESLGGHKALQDVQQILKEMDEQEEKLKNMHDTKMDNASCNGSSKSIGEKNSHDWIERVDTLSIMSTDSSHSEKSTVLCRPELKRNNSCKKLPKGNTDIVDDIEISICSDQNNERDLNNLANSLDLKHSKKNESNAEEVVTNNHNGKRLRKPSSSPSLRTVSLVDLWNSGNNVEEKSADKCIQKLQEEKLRRTHCEELIQQLQNKILEQQEKLAVAIQVDEAKDTAIIRFHDAWEKVTMKFKQLLQERDQLENDFSNLVEQNKKISGDCDERIEFHRKETNEALLMAKEHKSQLGALEKKCKDLNAENQSLKAKNQELQNKIVNVEEKNKQLSNILANKEIELNESKNIMLQAKKEVAQCQAAVEMCQKDFSTIKTEYDLIQEELQNERLNVSQLHEQNKAIHEELEEQKKTEKILMENLQEAQGKLENNKRELRNFYQGQVELLVQTKLKEFQTQLDEAEGKMKRELSKKETEIAKAAAMHIQQMTVKHDLEINLLGQKHQEEMQLKQVRAAQLEQRLHDLQAKLDRQQDRRSDLIRQLQKMMEAQWTEAMRIINQSRSLTASPLTHRDDSASTIDRQLQSLHSKSYQNVEALLMRGGDDFDEDVAVATSTNRRQKTPQTTTTQRLNYETANYCAQPDRRGYGSGAATGAGGHNRNRRGGDRCRRKGNEPEKEEEEGDDELQRYIDLLLHKQPGNSLGPERPKSPKFFCDQSQPEKSTWQQNTKFPRSPYTEYPEKDRFKKDSEKRKTSER